MEEIDYKNFRKNILQHYTVAELKGELDARGMIPQPEAFNEEPIDAKGFGPKPEPAPKVEDAQGFSITCSKCGRVDSVPFEPKYNTAVYCRECFQKKKNGEL